MKRQKKSNESQHQEADLSDSSEITEDDSITLSSGSSTDIEYTTTYSTKITQDDIQLLLDMNKIIPDKTKLCEVATDIVTLQSGDVVLGLVLRVPYSDFIQILSKQVKKKINSVVDDSEKITYLHIERICNSPLDEVVKLYKEIRIEDDRKYLLASRMTKVEKCDRNDVFETYPEFLQKDLDFLPYRSEEIFLLKVCDSFKLVEINGVSHRLFVLNKKQFTKYIDLIENEISGYKED